ncbi:MAG: hypothetical protein ACOYOQ_00535 [Microthrixaceae bacterium]
MGDTPITDAIERTSTDRRRLLELAAAALTGPLAEDVECPECGGWAADPDRVARVAAVPCPTCSGSGTVRLVVHVVTPEVAKVANRLLSGAAAYSAPDGPWADALRFAVDVLNPQDGER